MFRLQNECAGADLIGERRHAQIDAFAGIPFARPVQRLMLTELLEQDHRQKGSGRRSPVGLRGRGAGGCVIFSHSRHENLARTVWITFHWRGITSSVSVMSSPSFDSFVDPSTGAAFRRDDDDALARQMLGERLARCP